MTHPFQHKHVNFIFINNLLLVHKGHDWQAGLPIFRDVPTDLNSYKDDRQTLIVRSEYGLHVLLDLHHLEFSHDKYELVSLRDTLNIANNDDFQHIAQAWQYALFLRTHRYCGRCGHDMRRVSWEMAMHCDKCSHRVYPRVSPCIIVAIHDGKRLLLAQGVRHKAAFYSTLAGFVESAESLEQAVHREVFEEVGVTLGDIEYTHSQPWPFPHSLMCGYIARYASGDIKIQENEILDAQWFDIDNLPAVPSKHSIAGQLIEETVRRIKQGIIN